MVFLSPIFGGACKFYPSCSNYAYEAVARHGARRGALLALKRLLRCHPFTKGGFDPVPDTIYETGSLEEIQAAEFSSESAAAQAGGHKPTHAVLGETWAAPGTLGMERRL